jgi:hypothetical protein
MMKFPLTNSDRERTPGEEVSPEWLAARASYEAFCAEMSVFLASPPVWEKVPAQVRSGWLAAAKAAQSHMHFHAS